MIHDVCDQLASFCAGYFTLGEKLFNQSVIALERVLADPYHADAYQVQVACDTLRASLQYFPPDEIPAHLACAMRSSRPTDA